MVMSHRKIFVHPRLALAVAAAGMGAFQVKPPPALQPTTTEIIESVLTNLQTRRLNIERVSDRLVAKFHRLVESSRNDPRWSAFGVEGVDLVIVLMSSAGARVCLLRITDKVEAFSGKNAAIMRPPCLEDFYSTGRFAPEGDGYGREPNTAEAICERARTAIEEGISAESTLHAAPMHAGPPVDVALVDKDGARFVSGGDVL